MRKRTELIQQLEKVGIIVSKEEAGAALSKFKGELLQAKQEFMQQRQTAAAKAAAGGSVPVVNRPPPPSPSPTTDRKRKREREKKRATSLSAVKKRLSLSKADRSSGGRSSGSSSSSSSSGSSSSSSGNYNNGNNQQQCHDDEAFARQLQERELYEQKQQQPQQPLHFKQQPQPQLQQPTTLLAFSVAALHRLGTVYRAHDHPEQCSGTLKAAALLQNGWETFETNRTGGVPILCHDSIKAFKVATKGFGNFSCWLVQEIICNRNEIPFAEAYLLETRTTPPDSKKQTSYYKQKYDWDLFKLDSEQKPKCNCTGGRHGYHYAVKATNQQNGSIYWGCGARPYNRYHSKHCGFSRPIPFEWET